MAAQVSKPDPADVMRRMQACAAAGCPAELQGSYDERVLQYHAALACGVTVANGADDLKWGDRNYPPEVWQRFIGRAAEPEAKRAALPVATRQTRRGRPDGRKHYQFDKLRRACAVTFDGRRLCVWLAGPAGSGKSTLACQVAEALELPFYAIGAVTSDFRLVGFMDAAGETVRTPFREAYEHGGVFLFDEIDASSPNALVALNQALANDRFAFPDGMVARHEDFVCIAAANTYGHGATADYVGRTKIDAATLDRFVRMEIGYDERLERALAGPQHKDWVMRVQKLRAAVQELGVKIIVSPRATLHGIALHEAGWDAASIENAVIFNGVDSQTRQKILNAAE